MCSAVHQINFLLHLSMHLSHNSLSAEGSTHVLTDKTIRISTKGGNSGGSSCCKLALVFDRTESLDQLVQSYERNGVVVTREIEAVLDHSKDFHQFNDLKRGGLPNMNDPAGSHHLALACVHPQDAHTHTHTHTQQQHLAKTARMNIAWMMVVRPPSIQPLTIVYYASSY
jgi:hypothetical protein